MGTRSLIGLELLDGSVEYIYCHWDGYIDGVGKTLHEHYPARQAVEALLALGDLSSLGEEIGEKHDFDFGMNLERNDPERERLYRMCNAYGRDRGKDKIEKKRIANRDLFLTEPRMGQEYYYLWPKDNSGWLVSEGGVGFFGMTSDKPRTPYVPLVDKLKPAPKPKRAPAKPAEPKAKAKAKRRA